MTTTSRQDHPMPTSQIDEFVPVLFDDDLWAETTSTRAGRLNARTLLNGLRRDLKSQRTERSATLTAPEFRQWLASQARFERVVNARFSEIEQALHDDPVPGLRRQVTRLLDVVGTLAAALDESDEHADLLERVTITFGTDELTLAEALDEDRWANRVPL